MPTVDDFPKDLAADAVLPFTLSGISLEIPRSILTPELWLAFEAGYYEGSEISALRTAIRPGDAVLEVGAGVGFISAFVQRVLGAAKVWVIEANEALIPTIRRTHELNGVSATVLTGVAGHRDGPVRFHHQAAFWGSSVLPLSDSQAATVPGIDLAEIIREMRPDVLVVDIEGGERDLFAGLDLSSIRSIVVEVHHPQIGPAGIAKCFAALQDAGFAYYPDGSAGTNVLFTRFRRSPSNGSKSDVPGEICLGDHPGIVLPNLPCKAAFEVVDLIASDNIAKIISLDTNVFSIQPGHNSDRVSFLRIQSLVREVRPGYTYLEVGSDIGGSLLPHLLDPCCAAAVSIDTRPEEQPDERGVEFQYVGNSTERMRLELGRHVRPRELSKLSTIDRDISAVDPSCFTIRPELVLIDAEHTNVAAFSDFMAVLPLIGDDALVTFHDADLVGDAIQMIERFLQHSRIPYVLTVLPSCVAVFGFGTFIHSMETALKPHAKPTTVYFARARHQRYQLVADAIISQTEGLPGHSISELVAAIGTVNADRARLGLALEQAKAVYADSLRQELEIAREERAQVQSRLTALEHSTAWRVTGPLRGAARRLPKGLRRNLARSVYVAWWTVSLQLPARLRQRALRNATASTPLVAIPDSAADVVISQTAACVIAATGSQPEAAAIAAPLQALGVDVTGWVDPIDSDKDYWHRYSAFYQRHFATLRPVSSILEFGVFHGASIRWLRQMYPDAEIVAVDILPLQPDWPIDPRITYLTVDQGDRAAIAQMLKNLNRNFDLVIEDGSHIPQHQATCLAEAFPLVRPGGLYVLEDLQTSHPTHPYYREHCAGGTPDSLHLLLLVEHLRATGQALRSGDVASLSAPGLFTPEDVYQLSETIAEVDLYHRTTLPLRCYVCGTDDFDPVTLLCRCGNDLDILGADSMTAVIRRSTVIPGLQAVEEEYAMMEVDQTISSLPEWEKWVEMNPSVYHSAAAAEIGQRILRAGFIEPLTGKFVRSNEIAHSGSNWREGLMANGLNSRIRAVVAMIAEKVAGRPASAVRIFGAEAVTSFALLMRGYFSRFIGSEYGMNEAARLALFPIPHQDLTALTFPSDCFDIVTTNEVLEHVPDLDAALREMVRVLKPGGWHIGTHPFWFMKAESDRRSEIKNGEIVHLKEAEYHGNPVDTEGGSLVFETPGWDIIDRAKAAGFKDAHMRFVASERYGYVTENTGVFVFCAQK